MEVGIMREKSRRPRIKKKNRIVGITQIMKTWPKFIKWVVRGEMGRQTKEEK